MGWNLYRRNDVKVLGTAKLKLSVFFFLVSLCMNAVFGQEPRVPEQKKEAAAVINSVYPSLLPESYAADFERPEVEVYRKRYLQSFEAKSLYSILKNGEQYRYYVHRRILEENMPLFLEFIPVIESSYKPLAMPEDARSVGLWQFLENSIENYLRKTKWVDERRDPWKSTDAALKKLKANYDMFGDWLLAVAAYNCGAGAVSRALKKVPQKTFWALSEKRLIPEHAVKYVPNLLAVSDAVASNRIEVPEFYFDKQTYSPFDDFDYITVKKSLHLKTLAMEMRISPQILESLNPELLYGITPPGEDYEIRLPAGMTRSAQDAIFCLMLKEGSADTE